MKLIAIYKDQKYHMVKGVDHVINEVDGKFILEKIHIVPGRGTVSVPVAFFDEDWEGVYGT